MIEKFRSLIKIRLNQKFVIARVFAEFALRAGSLITFPLLSRAIGAEGYGVNSQLGVINSVLWPIATVGMGFSIVRMITGNKNKEYVSARFNSSILLVLCTSLLLASFVFFLAPFINDLFFKVSWATPVIQWSSLLIVLTAIEQVLNDYYRSRLRIVAYSVEQIIQIIIYVIGLVIILNRSGGLLQVVLLNITLKFIFILILLIYFIHAGEIIPKKIFMPRNELLEMIRFGIPVVVMGIGAWVMSLGDRFVIGYFMDSKQVGIYNAAYTLAGLITSLGAPFWSPLYPHMALYKNSNDIEGLYNICRKYSTMYFLFSIPAIIGLIILSNEMIHILGTSEFILSIFVFPPIVIGLFLDQFSSSSQYLIYLHNQPIFMRNVMILAGVFNLFLNVFLVPTFGILGSSIATLATYILLTILFLRKIHTFGYQIKKLYDFRSIITFIISAIFMAVVLYLIKSIFTGNFGLLLILIFIGLFSYFIFLFGINRFNINKLFDYL